MSDRSFYNNVARETISENVFIGSGLGTFIFQIDGYLKSNNIDQKLDYWKYQPAHNFYFLIASEIGMLGLLVFLLIIFEIVSRNAKNIALSANKRHSINFFNVSRETMYINRSRLSNVLLIIILSFLLIGLFDYYFWTLQQGMLIFWIVLGLIAANSRD